MKNSDSHYPAFLALWLGLCLLFCTSAVAQTNDQIPFALLESLPKELQLKESEPQRYQMIADYFNKDLFGRFFNKMRVSGQYTRGLEGGYVRWNEVSIAETSREEGEFPAGKSQSYMENFRYIPGDKMLEAESFANFPPNSVFAQNLIWDAMGFETFAWDYFDSLQLNIPFRAQGVEGELELAGQGTFENKNIQLTWTGLSLFNGELCALIQFKAMDNPLEMQSDQMDIKGRSHYWGNIWVSLQDKQIEHVTLSEDVVMEMKLAGQTNSQYLNATRELVFKKMN